jgi:hypothetical protein
MQYILGSKSVSFILDGQPKAINREAEIFPAALEAIKQDNVDALRDIMQMKKTIVAKVAEIGGDMVTVTGNKVMYGTREITGVVTSRIFEMLRYGMNITPMLNFLTRLMKNPSKRAVDEAFSFADACSLPITEDGCLLAYRKNGVGYKDSHSGTVVSKPVACMTAEEIAKYSTGAIGGKENNVTMKIEDGLMTVSMPRNAVDEEKNNLCSAGLHFCSFDYLNHFSGKHILVIKIDPADIVSIPADYNNAKGRCSKYQVVDEISMNPAGLPEKQITQEYAKEVVDSKEYPTAKMTSVKAAKFREALNSGDKTLTELCDEYGISRRQGARIRDFEAWAN